MTLNEAVEKQDMPKRMSVITGCLLGVILSLLVVGLVSGTLARHVIQITPVVLAFATSVRKMKWSPFAAVPIFIFWTVIMLFIWLWLLGIAKIASGHFTPVEIAMTIVVGICCLWGILNFPRGLVSVRFRVKSLVFCIFLALQVCAMWISLLKPFVQE